jgi:hypothetical protein
MDRAGVLRGTYSREYFYRIKTDIAVAGWRGAGLATCARAKRNPIDFSVALGGASGSSRGQVSVALGVKCLLAGAARLGARLRGHDTCYAGSFAGRYLVGRGEASA